MIELNDTLFDTGPVTVLQALVIGVMLLVFGFALWRARRISPGPVLQFSDNPLLNAVGWAAILLALPGALLFLATLFELFRLTFSFPDASDEAALRRHATLMLSLLAAIGALVGLVFGVIRVFAVERQTSAQELKNDLEAEALFNDKINAATQGLYARRQKTLGEGENTRDYWQDDIVQRNAAIDRLEGLAQERPSETPRIARLLSVYVRELSAEVPPQDPPEDATPDAIREWVWSLPKPRSDMEKAAQTLGRLSNIAREPLENGEIDLRGANLQRADLRGAKLEKALLQKAQLQGADLRGAQLQGADLSEARLQDAQLSYAQLQRAVLRAAQLQGADLYETQLQGASLGGARLQEANLSRALLQGTYLGGARLQGALLNSAKLQGAYLIMTQFDQATSLTEATLQGAALMSIDFTSIPQINVHVGDLIGDASVTLPNGVTPDHPSWPDHWSREKLDFRKFQERWRAWQATLPPGWDKDVPESSKP